MLSCLFKESKRSSNGMELDSRLALRSLAMVEAHKDQPDIATAPNPTLHTNS